MTHQLQGRFVDVAPDLVYGEDCTIWCFTVIGAGVVMGHHCVIGSGVYLGRGTHLGDHVHIQHGAFLPNNTVVGSHVLIGPNVTMTDDKYPVAGNTHYTAEPPVIEDEVSIGAGAVLCPGVRLGRGSRIGAGAVVTRDAAPGVTIVGNPARVCDASVAAHASQDGILQSHD